MVLLFGLAPFSTAGHRLESQTEDLRLALRGPRPTRARIVIENAIADDPALTELVASVQRRQIDPLTAAERIVATVLGEELRDAADAR